MIFPPQKALTIQKKKKIEIGKITKKMKNVSTNHKSNHDKSHI